MTTQPSLRVDGVWLDVAGLPYSELEWTDRADGGNFEASWSMVLDYGSRPAPLFPGSRVEIYLGPVRRWYGEVETADWDGGDFTATGMSQRAYDFGARTLGGQTTSTPDIAIDTAIGYDGWAITRPTSFSAIPVVAGDVTDDQNNVGAILDQAALALGVRWGIWGDGAIRTYAPATTYDYLLAPGAIELGETTEDTFTKVIARYINASTGQRSLVGSDAPGRRVVTTTLQDLTNLGPISSTTAQGIADNLIALGASSPGWTQGAEVSSAQLLTPGGLPAEVAAVTAGQVVRAAVVGDQGQSYRDLVIGETKHEAGTDVLSLSPTNKVPSNLSEVIEDTYTRLTGQPVSA